VRSLIRKSLFIGASLLLLGSVASSKASLSKLLLSGRGLPQPIEITDSQLLGSSNPWFGSFIAGWKEPFDSAIASVPSNAAPRYQITFFANASGQEPHVIYVAYYVFESATHRGLVYLPGPHDPGYSLNIGTIVRPHQDGRWNPANPAWCDQMNSIIARSQSR
jgi:hypothetical protein